MVEHSKRKKHHDKDKYYHLAKEQGLRSRAAFKLTQINRKHPVLEKCTRGVLDLCAAPGGWTQIAARTCPKNIPIIAVDILPIRHFSGLHNIKTIVGDITTDKCKADIKHSLGGGMVDVVLHDGAPNVGAEYGKDAYEQNEIALHALRCATQHLVKQGTFITKIYRSRDYAKYHWILTQLFGSVEALKPKASRAQSAEIFLIAKDYKAPAKIDPRLLDPKVVFESVEGETTGGAVSSGNPLSIFHKNRDKQTRQRGGYDMEHLDAVMRHIETVADFVTAGPLQEAIQILSKSTGLAFTCKKCDTGSCDCKFFLHHPLTTNEIKESLTDLQVLNKSDFKMLLGWRTKMQDALKAKMEQRQGTKEDQNVSSSEDESADSDAEDKSDADKDEEDEILGEIEEMKRRRMREKKRLKKKERAQAAKRRRKAALGMDLNAVDVPEHDKLFSLATITSKGDLAAASEVNLDQVNDEQIFGDSDDDIVLGEDPKDGDSDDEAARMRRRERDLELAYDSYLSNTKSQEAKSATKMQKRSKKLQRLKVAEEAEEDQELAMTTTDYMKDDAKAYIKLLQGPKDSDSEEESSEEEDDGFDADPATPEEHAIYASSNKRGDSNPLIHKFEDEPPAEKTARWFSNPLFQNIGKALQSKSSKKSAESDDENGGDVRSVASEDNASSDEDAPAKKKSKIGLVADEILAMMPKTDKQKRHEKRLKQLAKDERKVARRAKTLGEAEADFEIAPAETGGEDEEDDEMLRNVSESRRKKIMEARELIKAGLGTSVVDADNDKKAIEIVSEGDINTKRPLAVKDDRKYDSEHEDYDSDDYAETLALGTMILRKSKEKSLVDASYNRYAWNDPGDLPEWFVDDEKKHHRPQLPIPPALLAKMKEKMMALSAKPIKKVAEARARKQKRAKQKLVAAKKQAEAVANSADMSESMKLKAISKALRGQDVKKPGKSYAVAKKGRGMNGAKGVKFVDKRLKSDKRAMERKEKKSKKGKQNGLVGSKKRRQHG